MHLLNSFFDKIFIITIPRNADRLRAFLNQHPQLNVEIFTGTDGKELYPEIEYVHGFPATFFEENKLDYNRCKAMNKSQLGAVISHRGAQTLIINQQLNNALILEDDALYIEENINFFNKAILEIPADWELFYLGHNVISPYSEKKWSRFLLRFRYFFFPVKIEGLSSSNLKKRFLPLPFSANLKIPGVYTGGHAYGLSYEGACKTVALDTPLKHGYDCLLLYANYHKLLKSYALIKHLFVPNSKFETTLIN